MVKIGFCNRGIAWAYLGYSLDLVKLDAHVVLFCFFVENHVDYRGYFA